MAATANWTLETDADGVAWLTFDLLDAGVNVLSRAVLRELGAALSRVAAARPKALVLRSGKASGFIAGADIGEFETIKEDRKSVV